MGQPFVGEIRMFGGNFAPAGWAFCSGQLMPISENEALFNLIGTTYGGDGEETFALPDLQGRVPIHAGQGPGISQSYQLGEKAGVEIGYAHRQSTPNPHSRAARFQRSRQRDRPGWKSSWRNPFNTFPYFPAAGALQLNAQTLQPARRQPAARQHDAVPLRQLHHFAVRHFPDADLEVDHVRPVRRRNPDFRLSTSPPPAGRPCDGQLLPISQNTALFSLLGTFYGGDGKSTFALPDFDGSAADAPGARRRAFGPLSRRDRRRTVRHPASNGNAFT